MTYDIDAQGRLDFLQIRESDRQALRSFRPVLQANIAAILDQFYAHATANPRVSAFFNGKAVAHARQQQQNHWLDNVFVGSFNDAYFANVQRIGQVHAAIGLEPRWYIAGYCLALNRIIALVNQHYRKQPQVRDEVVAAVNKAVFLDMDIAISVYFQDIKSTAAHLLQSKGDNFEGVVVSTVGVVARAVVDLESTARTMTTLAEQTQAKASTVAAAAAEAAENVHTIAAATEQLTASIDEINRQVTHSTTISTNAVDEADRADKIILSLSEAAQRIGDVVDLIGDIAAQTNLLALNATIEAARAGDAGKGFAVVAGEVKNLANQTARATGEISGQIAAVQTATKSAVEAIQGINRTISQMSGISQAIAAAVDEQGIASREISKSISQTDNGTRVVKEEIQYVDQATRQTGDAASTVLTATRQLSQQSDALLGQVKDFVQTLRA